jgi:hypothetical protein
MPFAMLFTGPDRDLNLATEHPEFSAWRLISFAEAIARIAPFKRRIYEALGRAESIVKNPVWHCHVADRKRDWLAVRRLTSPRGTRQIAVISHTAMEFAV